VDSLHAVAGAPAPPKAPFADIISGGERPQTAGLVLSGVGTPEPPSGPLPPAWPASVSLHPGAGAPEPPSCSGPPEASSDAYASSSSAAFGGPARCHGLRPFDSAGPPRRWNPPPLPRARHGRTHRRDEASERPQNSVSRGHAGAGTPVTSRLHPCPGNRQVVSYPPALPRAQSERESWTQLSGEQIC